MIRSRLGRVSTLLSFAWIAVAATAEAEAPAPEIESVPQAESASFAVGIAPVFELRRDFGDDTRFVFSPELVVVTYIALGTSRIYLRPGLRLGFENVFQVEMPEEVRVRERGVSGRIEVGLLFDGPIVPAFALGLGGVARSIDFDVAGAVSPPPDAHRLEWLPSISAQLGLGIPMFRGLLVFEPFMRAEVVFGDDRSRLRFGFDSTLAF